MRKKEINLVIASKKSIVVKAWRRQERKARIGRTSNSISKQMTFI